MRLTALLAVTLMAAAFVAQVKAQDQSSGKVHGYVFGDYFYKAGGDTALKAGSSQYATVPEHFQAFQLRRIYLYYDHTFSKEFVSQFLLEGNDKIFESGGRHGVFIKTAYLEWKDVIPMGSIAIGLVPTPTWSWGLSEKTWGYRFIEKTVADFRGMGRASDIGIGFRGKFLEDGSIGYHAMIGNGSGQGEEKDKHKNYYGALNAKPVKNMMIEAQAEYEPATNDKSKTLVKGFAAYHTKDLTIGVEVVQRTLKMAGTAGADVTPLGVAAFIHASLSDKINGYARFDLFDPNTKVKDAGYKENFFVVGIDFMPLNDIHFSPNVWINTFSAKGSMPKKAADVVTRLTFFFVYK
jgi:hypothetical protein